MVRIILTPTISGRFENFQKEAIMITLLGLASMVGLLIIAAISGSFLLEGLVLGHKATKQMFFLVLSAILIFAAYQVGEYFMEIRNKNQQTMFTE